LHRPGRPLDLLTQLECDTEGTGVIWACATA
jgi:hypothetical protein